MRRIAVGADGEGTMFERIIEAAHAGKLPDTEVVLLFANNAGAPAVAKARAASIPVLILSENSAARARQLHEALTVAYAPIHLVCLAGYLRLVPRNIVAAFPKRILNSHPALDLIRFGGKGMWGANVTKAVIGAGVKQTGSTVHFVDERYDHGAIIAHTEPIPVLPNDSPESLLARQYPRERELYLGVIKRFLGASY